MRRLSLVDGRGDAAPEPAAKSYVHDAPVLAVLAMDEALATGFVAALLGALVPARRPDLVVDGDAVVPDALRGLTHEARFVSEPEAAFRNGVPAVAVLGRRFASVRASLGVVVVPSYGALLHPRVLALRPALDVVIDDVRPGFAALLAETFAKPA